MIYGLLVVTLCLFCCLFVCLFSDNGQPRDVVKSILPSWNSFVFFDVNLKSFHQVKKRKCNSSLPGSLGRGEERFSGS